MPQLDKYIFFNHVVTLTIFFCLIYLFIRKDVIPQISTTLKYRKKRINLFNSQLDDYENVLKFSKINYENQGKNFTTKVFDSLEKLINFYDTKSTEELHKIYKQSWNVTSSNTVYNFIFKNRKEFKRLSSTQ